MKISVVMAAFNGQSHLAGQLESIVNNSRPPDEIIIVDDASTDHTIRIAERIKATSRIPIKLHVNDENIGPTRSFIKGTRSALGDIILFSDQDDRWHPDKIIRMIEPFVHDPMVLMTYSDGIITDGDGKPLGRTIFSTRKRKDLHLGNDRTVTSIISDPDIKGCTMAVRTTLARLAFSQNQVRFWPYWGHDHWIAALAYAYGKVTVIDAALIEHRFHGRNASAGVRFDPFVPSHWSLWMGRVRAQSNDHDLIKYRLLEDHLLKHEHLIHRAGILDEVRSHIELAGQRSQIRMAKLPVRFYRALQLWKRGIYGKYYNGFWTFLRDAVL